MAEKDLRYFYPPLASAIGVPASVIHYNFTHWMDELKKDKKEAVFSLAPATLVTLQPFANRTLSVLFKLWWTSN